VSVLVTGGAGYIGSHTVLRLCDAGRNVVVLDNLSTGFDWAVDARAELVVGEISDEALVGELIARHAITAIIHFAGSIIVPESVADPLKYYRNNTAASRNLIAAAVAGGVGHMIFSSTAAVYGMPGLEPVGEDSALAPVSPYGRSKLMTEMMLADVAAAHPLTYGVLRYFNVAGADPAGRSGQSTAGATHLIKVAAEAALGKRSSVAVFGSDFPTPDGTGVRDYIHVSDLADAHALLLDHLEAGGASTTLNCGYGRGASVREVLAAVRRVSGKDFTVVESPRRPGDPAAIVARADKVRSLLGWVPAHDDLDGIIASALRWEQHLATRNH
jgi:UDP-glucose 4-epimerase